MDPSHNPFDGFPQDMQAPEPYRDFAEPLRDTFEQADYEQLFGLLNVKHYGGKLTVTNELREEAGRIHTNMTPGKAETIYESFRVPKGS